MKLYNTLTRTIEEFKPLAPPRATLYSCGPTVYDYPHIGNWFTFIRYDILVRTLKSAGFKPNWVMNITDVGHLVSDADEGEDKLEKGAKREGKNAWQIAERYTNYFTEGLERLNIFKPNELPRATEHIHEQIDLIKDLEKKGYTYAISDGVYYDTSKFADYGKLARLDIKNLKEGARVEVNPEKHNPTDFALWKFTPKNQKRDMEWESPWGKGFPGWHIECSAMSIKYLGETLDIHAGGIDHIPVHHTNEIAQSEAATGQKFANFWVHMNHITIGEQKIAKSQGNGITLEDIENRGFSLDTLRLLVLESHYRTQAEFSWDTLQAAANRLKDLQAMADLKWQASDQGKFNEEAIKKAKQAIGQAMENDLNSPVALANLSTVSKVLETNGLNKGASRDFKEFTLWLDDLFGLNLSDRPDIEDSQKHLIDQRESARQKQDWSQADNLRGQLEKDGIGIRDTELGPIWCRL
jgi:cysteinyl-tRNA synthetase